MDYDTGYAEGKQDGQKVSQTQWFAAGCVGGGLPYFLVTGDTPTRIPEGSNEFRVGYVDGYKDATKSKKKTERSDRCSCRNRISSSGFCRASATAGVAYVGIVIRESGRKEERKGTR